MTSVYFLYAPADAAAAREAIRALTESGRLTLLRDGEGSALLTAGSAVPRDAAVVFVSDAAVRDEVWQRRVRGLAGDVRRIPVGGTQDADYSDPQVIPPELERINFIPSDGRYADSVWESLTTDESFFELRSRLLSSMQAWELSNRSEAFLLDSLSEIRRSLRAVQEKRAAETDAYFAAGLDRLADYLKRSRRYARRERIRRLWAGTRLAAMIAAAILMIGLYLAVSPYLTRVKTASILLLSDSGDVLAPVSAVKLTDGIYNPLVPDEIKPALYSDLVGYLDQNWPNTAISPYYRWALNDAVLSPGEESLLTADGKGHAILWELCSGAVLRDDAVSEEPLSAIDLSEDGSLAVCADAAGFLYAQRGGGDWVRSAEPFDIPFFSSVRLRCTGDRAAVRVPEGLLLFSVSASGETALISSFPFDSVLCFAFSGDELEAAVVLDGALYAASVDADGSLSLTPVPLTPYSAFTPAVRDGVFLLADESGALWVFSARDESLAPSGIASQSPIAAAFLGGGAVAVHDRNLGTRLFDLTIGVELGEALASAPALDELSARGSTVLGKGSYLYHSEDVSSLLPASADGIVRSHTGRNGTSGGTVREVSIDGGGRVTLRLALADGVTETEIAPEGGFGGTPCTAAVTADGTTAAIGTENGCFLELTFTGEGSWTVTARRTLPTRTPVAAIHETADGYLLEDAGGFLWKARSGRGAVTYPGLVAAVREKLCSGFSDDIRTVVSDELLEQLEVDWMPGHDGKEWG